MLNVMKKDEEVSKVCVVSSIVLPMVIYLINWIIIKIKVSTQLGYIDKSNDISSYVMIITIFVEAGLAFYLYKKDKLNSLWILGIIITVINCYLVWYITSSVGAIIISEKGFSYEEIYEEIKNTIGASMFFSVLDLNIFSFLAAKNKDSI